MVSIIQFSHPTASFFSDQCNDDWVFSSNLLVVASVLGPSLAFLEGTLITGYR
jgi:hypothetical protein